MKWHGFNIARARSREYRKLPREVIGSHHLMLIGCAAFERFNSVGKRLWGNDGVWRDSRDWDNEDWLQFAGVRLTEVHALVAHGLAEWASRDVTNMLLVDLTPTREQLEEHRERNRNEPYDWERCRITREAIAKARAAAADELLIGVADRCQVTDQTDQKRPINADQQTDQDFDLLVVDYDLGGQVKAQITSEIAKANGQLGGRPKQEILPGLDGRMRNDTDQHTDQRNFDNRPLTTGTGTGTREERRTPPYPPHGGGVSEAALSREDAGLLDGFWRGGYLPLKPRDRGLPWPTWGAAKEDLFRAIVQRSKGDPSADPLPKEPIPLRELLDRLRADLTAKFADERWVTEMIQSKIGLRRYISRDMWKEPLPDGPRLRVVREPTPAELEREAEQRRARQAAEEKELRDTWADEMPGHPFPADLAEARRRLKQKHWGAPPPAVPS